MHIAFLTTEYPHTHTGSSGGLGISIFILAHALVNKGERVSVFIYGQPKDGEFLDSQIKIVKIKNAKLKGISWWLTRKKIQKIINERILKDKIQILEVADWTGISAWLRIKCPIIMRLHGSDSYFCNLDKRPVKKWNFLQEKVAYKNASKIIAVSNFVGMRTNGVFGLKRNYIVIPNSIDISSFEVASELDTKSNIILYFGTLIRKKGAFDIPHIFNKVHEKNKDVQLVLVGGDASDIQTGSSSTWSLMMEDFTLSSLNKVSYLGKVAYSQIQDFINYSDVCIFPSYAEALPVSWLEAMAMGKAIVASDIGWANEMIEDGVQGYLVDPSDHNAFANRILELLTDINLRKRLGQKARLRVQNEFSTELIVQTNIEFYNDQLRTHKK